MARALLVVDVQRDFLPGGALAVKDGDQVVAPINSLLAERARLFDYVVATRDFHPEMHESFASMHPGHKVGDVIKLHGLSQVLWPDHCVQGSRGSAFADDLWLARVDEVFVKGTNPQVDSYSAFFDNARRQDTGLNRWLRSRGVRQVVIAGLATDYCVKFTALDALAEGYSVAIAADACRAVNLHRTDGDQAIERMVLSGAHCLRSSTVLGGLF